MDPVTGKLGSISVWRGSDLENEAREFGLIHVPRERWESAAQNTNTRVAERLATDRMEAIRFGAFSYLVELSNLEVELKSEMADFAVRVAEKFLSENLIAKSPSPTSGELRHFAAVIQNNLYDWQSMLIAYLDPESSRLDRLRQNLKLTPLERVARHRKLILLLKGAHRVER